MNDNIDNMQRYESEIDFRKLIMAFWRQKIIIVSITLVFAIVAGLYSMFLISPVYETSMNIVISMPETFITRYGEYKLPINSNGEYLKLIKSNDVLVNTINDMGYDTNEVSLDNIKNRITVGEIKTNVTQNSFIITVSASNPEESLKLAKQLYKNYINFMDAMMKERAINYYYNDFTVQIASLENTLIKTQAIIDKNEELLKNTPETIDQKNAAQEIEMNVTDYIILEDIINPNYTTLQGKIIENKQLKIDTQTTIDLYTKYLADLNTEKTALDEYYASGDISKLESSIMKIIEVSIYQPSEPVAPTSETGTGTLMYVAIGGILGGMLSVMIAFFRAYWRKEI
jgi:capsular polysaccharide biosynthesis protein